MSNGTFGKCREYCPGGNQCGCNGIRHVYHICRLINCECHRQYEPIPDAESRRRKKKKVEADYIAGKLNLWRMMRRIKETGKGRG
jgi:hypothetical protein